MINNQDFKNLADFFRFPLPNLAGCIIHYSLYLCRASLEAFGQRVQLSSVYYRSKISVNELFVHFKSRILANFPADAPDLYYFRHAVLDLLIASDANHFNEVLFVNDLKSFSHQCFESEAALLGLCLHHLEG